MALWFVSYATTPITVTIYDVSIAIVYDVTLLLSMTYHFQSRLGKTDCTDIWVIKLKNQVLLSIGFRVPHCLFTAKINLLSILSKKKLVEKKVSIILDEFVIKPAYGYLPNKHSLLFY